MTREAQMLQTLLPPMIHLPVLLSLVLKRSPQSPKTKGPRSAYLGM